MASLIRMPQEEGAVSDSVAPPYPRRNNGSVREGGCMCVRAQRHLRTSEKHRTSENSVSFSRLVVLAYIRNTLRHRTGPTPIEKSRVAVPRRGDEGAPGPIMNSL
jgi:hypothetical protein